MRKYLLPIIIALFSLVSSVKSKAQVNVQDSLALVDFYNSTDGPNWGTKWNLNDPVNTWHGVGVTYNKVLRIFVAANFLSGSIPSSFGNLKDLQLLALQGNNLTGELPASLGNLTNLQTMDLFNNHFSGSIPPELANAVSITRIDLSGSQLTGSIPPELGNLTHLVTLALAGNQLSGPVPSTFRGLPDLAYLDFTGNQLSGYFPLLLDSIYVPKIYLGGNHFTFDGIEQSVAFEKGIYADALTYAPQLPIPLYHNLDSTRLYVSAGGTTSNNTFKLYRNDVLVSTQVADSVFFINTSGDYHIEVANAIATALTLRSDVLTADTSLVERDSLALVDLYNSTSGARWRHSTNWLSAQPLSSWYGVTVRNNRVIGLSLDTNNLKGPLLTSFGNLTALDTLSLYYNFISGDFPSSIGNLTNLTYLEAARNYFTGSLPSSIGNLTALRTLDLGQQQYMSGPLPSSIGNLTNLDTLALFYIGATGAVPASYGNLVKLKYLDISGNSWSDTLPASLGNLVNLTYFDASSGSLPGSFPAFISHLAKLRVLHVSNTRISGPIPAFLGTLSSLEEVNLAGNRLSGPIPSSLTVLPKLTALDLRFNRFTFAGMEAIAKAYPFAIYSEQDDIPLYYYKGTYSVSVGGTPSNNTYTWYQYLNDEDDDEVVATKVADSTFTPTTTGIYYVEVSNAIATDENNYNRSLYLLSEEFVEPVENPAILPATPATLFASREETDTTGWTNYYYDNNTPYDDSDDILVLALQKRGQNIGTLGDGTFKVQLTATDSAGSNTAIKLTNPLITNPSGFWVMNRFWNVIPSSQPKSDVGVRFYYNNQDVTDINGSYPAHNLANDGLILYKEVGGNPDPTTNLSGATKIISILPGAYASDTTWTYHQLSDTSQYAEFSVSSFSGGGGGGTGNGKALPVQLLSFTAAQTEAANTLQWTTSNETNSSYFVIERSTNGSQFTAIGTVTAKGNSSTSTAYSFADNSPLSGTTYYRLRIINTDGTFSYSETRYLERILRFTAAIYPNPVRDKVNIRFTSPASRQVTLTITNTAGKRLLTKSFTLSEGTSIQSLPFASAASGVYYVSCISASATITVKFIKQ